MKRLMIFLIMLIPAGLFAQQNSLNFTKESNNTYTAEVKSGVNSIQDAYNLFLKYAENKVKTDKMTILLLQFLKVIAISSSAVKFIKSRFFSFLLKYFCIFIITSNY